MKALGRIKMAIGGFVDRVARVDLAGGQVTYEQIPEDWALKYGGGRGLGVRYVFEKGADVDPLGPDNILCLITGPLTGTDVKMSGRIAAVTKSPLTGGVVDSHHGGWSGSRLKWAGFDGVIMEGRAENPVYLYIENSEVIINDASDLWGKGVHETVRTLLARHGEAGDEEDESPRKKRGTVSVIAIGQAGENLVKYAALINEHDRASGRGGTGAVMGSKNVKAVVIKGDHKDRPRANDQEAFKAADKETLAHIMDENVITSPRKGVLSVLGTNVLTNMVEAIGGLPTGNSQETAFGPDRAEKLSGEHVKETILVNDPTCHACPVACKKEVEITEGPYAGLHMESYEYESAWTFGSNCRNDHTASVAKLIDQCNDFGMDTIETGNVLSMYMEATERGLVDGDGLAWGDHAAMVATVGKIALRDGVGDILANGTAQAAKHFGNSDLAMTVKGMAIPAYDPRGIKGMGIGYATSNRGACHLRAYTPAAEVIGNVLGPAEITDPLAWEGKAELCIIFQHVHTMTDCLDICKFSTFAESLDDFAAQYRAVTGKEMDAGGLLLMGERVYNLERYYNNLAGLGKGSDYLPKRFTDEPSTMPGSEGHVCELDKMLPEYYEKRGWDDGVVPESKLKELGILD
jgi:aldehyde:ferredoxin oxidoreductase